MKFSKGSKICLVLVVFILLYQGTSWGDLPVQFYDNFDDGDYDGWSVLKYNGTPAEAPDVVASPEGYSVRGVGSGYTPPGLNVWLTHPLPISDATELKIEMRARSGPQWPNSTTVNLCSGNKQYSFMDYGESNQQARFYDSDDNIFSYSIIANVWHDFTWTRDPDGWWSFDMDGGPVEWMNFCQENQLTSFDRVSIEFLRDQSEIEWVRISGIPEPCTLGLLALGGVALPRRRRAVSTKDLRT